MPGFGYLRIAVYEQSIAKQVDLPDETLLAMVDRYTNRSLNRQLLDGLLENFTGFASKVQAATDILEARKNPTGETAKNINQIIETYRKEKTSQ